MTKKEDAAKKKQEKEAAKQAKQDKKFAKKLALQEAKNPKDVSYGADTSITAPADSPTEVKGSKGSVWLWVLIAVGGYFAWKMIRRK